MNGYVSNIEKQTLDNNNFRKVLYTTHNSQLVVMSLKPGEEIGLEVHGQDQFIRIESSTGKTILNGKKHDIKDGSAVVVPAGTKHNIINTSKEAHMKIYTLYTPPHHKDGVVHKTKAQAEKDDEEFDGKVSK